MSLRKSLEKRKKKYQGKNKSSWRCRCERCVAGKLHSGIKRRQRTVGQVEEFHAEHFMPDPHDADMDHFEEKYENIGYENY